LSEIRLSVRCFSHVKDALGRDVIEITLPAGASAADAITYVRKMNQTRLGALPLRVAVNKTFVTDETVLNDGDEIALIPPVQGG